MPNIDAKTNVWDFLIALVLAGSSCYCMTILKGVWHDTINVCMTCQGENCRLAAQNGLWLSGFLAAINIFLIICFAKRAKDVLSGIAAVAAKIKGKSEVFNCDGDK